MGQARYLSILFGKFAVRYERFYYDGEHRRLRLGWLHLAWGW